MSLQAVVAPALSSPFAGSPSLSTLVKKQTISSAGRVSRISTRTVVRAAAVDNEAQDAGLSRTVKLAMVGCLSALTIGQATVNPAYAFGDDKALVNSASGAVKKAQGTVESAAGDVKSQVSKAQKGVEKNLDSAKAGITGNISLDSFKNKADSALKGVSFSSNNVADVADVFGQGKNIADDAASKIKGQADRLSSNPAETVKSDVGAAAGKAQGKDAGGSVFDQIKGTADNVASKVTGQADRLSSNPTETVKSDVGAAGSKAKSNVSYNYNNVAEIADVFGQGKNIAEDAASKVKGQADRLSSNPAETVKSDVGAAAGKAQGKDAGGSVFDQIKGTADNIASQVTGQADRLSSNPTETIKSDVGAAGSRAKSNVSYNSNNVADIADVFGQGKDIAEDAASKVKGQANRLSSNPAETVKSDVGAAAGKAQGKDAGGSVFDQIKDTADNVASKVTGQADRLSSNPTETVKSDVGAAGSRAKSNVSYNYNNVADIADVFGQGKNIAEDAASKVKGQADRLSSNPAETVKSDVGAAAGKAQGKDAGGSVFDQIKDTADNVASKVTGQADRLSSNPAETVKSDVGAAAGKAKGNVSSAGNTVGAVADGGNVLDQLKGTADSAADKVKGQADRLSSNPAETVKSDVGAAAGKAQGKDVGNSVLDQIKGTADSVTGKAKGQADRLASNPAGSVASDVGAAADKAQSNVSSGKVGTAINKVTGNASYAANKVKDNIDAATPNSFEDFKEGVKLAFK